MASVRWTAAVMWVVLLSGGCASVPVSLVRAGPTDAGIEVAGLLACGGGGGAELELEPSRPLVLFVPGRGDSGTRYRELSSRFELEGWQTACFEYGERESIAESSGRLIRALERLETRLAPSRILLVGHSQGGLVARRALVLERPDSLRSNGRFTYGLVTISTPFGGVRASADCGRLWVHVLSLGTSALACHLLSGDSWLELPPSSDLVSRPGTLLPEVTDFVQVITDERRACREREDGRGCAASQSVFTLGEQRNAVIDADPRARRVLVAAGHAEIVGEVGAPPAKLIGLLEGEGVLVPLPGWGAGALVAARSLGDLPPPNEPGATRTRRRARVR